MSIKLIDRINSYQEQTDFKLLNRVPIVIVINGKNFLKVTSLLDKPFSSKFSECMMATTLKLCSEIEGATFAFHHNDEIVVICRNDQSTETSPWFDNKIQAIASVVSSIATLHFNSYAANADLNLFSGAYFKSKVFVVPNLIELINVIIYKQQQNFHTSIQSACFYELLKTYDKTYIKEMVQGLSFDEKIDLLREKCNIDFYEYQSSFRRGVAFYKSLQTSADGSMKNKWSINNELPIFSKDQSILNNIFRFVE